MSRLTILLLAWGLMIPEFALAQFGCVCWFGPGEPPLPQPPEPTRLEFRSHGLKMPDVDHLADYDAIYEKLSRPVTVDFVDVPFQEALEQLLTPRSLSYWIDVKSVMTEGARTDVLVNLELDEVPVLQALDVMLYQHSLRWKVEDDQILITPINSACENMTVCAYPLRNWRAAIDRHGHVAYSAPVAGAALAAILLVQEGRHSADIGPHVLWEQTVCWWDQTYRIALPRNALPRDALNQGLLAVLQRACQETSSCNWSGNGDSSGSLLELQGVKLLVRGSAQCQAEVKRILDSIRDLSEGKYDRRFVVIRPPGYSSAAEEKLNAVLDAPYTLKIDEEPLREVIDRLIDDMGINILLEEREISEEGQSSDVLISLDAENLPLCKVLELMLEPHDLVAVPVHGILHITAAVSCTDRTQTVLYDVSDLPANRHQQVLREFIKRHTSGDWDDDQDGEFIIVPVTSGILMIRQTDKVHLEIEALLEKMRQANAERTPVAALPLTAVTYQVEPPQALDGACEILYGLVEDQSGSSVGRFGNELLLRTTVCGHRRAEEFFAALESTYLSLDQSVLVDETDAMDGMEPSDEETPDDQSVGLTP